MKKRLAALLTFFLLSSCASPTPTNLPKAADTQLVLPTRMPFPTRISTLPPAVATTGKWIDPLEGVNLLADFSSFKADWQIIPGYVTAAQMNDAVARLEGDQVHREYQKVINGFLRTTVQKEDGQIFEVLMPAELVDGKLKELRVKKVEQVSILSIHSALLEDYFAINFPNIVDSWRAQGAQYEDFKYTAVITLTWATKFGPLRISYKLSGKYISEEGKYPGRVEFLKLCAYESTKSHYQPNGRLDVNWFPAPIVGLSGTARDASGEMQSDAFGWTPMVDFAKDESDTLSAIAQAVNGLAIESKETLSRLQAAFDRAFMPIHCAEVVVE